MIFTRRTFGLAARSPRRFLGKRLRKLTLSSTFRTRPQRVHFFIYFTTLIFLIIGTYYNFFSLTFLRGSLLDLSAPIFEKVNQPFHKIHSYMEDIKSLMILSSHVEELQRLEQEKDLWKAKAEILESQNAQLKNQFNLTTVAENVNIVRFPSFKNTAYVIANPGGVYTRNIIIEGGMQQGILKGDSAVTMKGLVGRIIEAGNNASRVLLITDVDSRVPVTTQKSGHHAILTGDNDLLPRLTRLQEDMTKPKPSVGERVITSGYGGVFPPGIPVGVIASEEEGIYRVRPFVDLEMLDVVGVVSSFKPLLEEISLGAEFDFHPPS